MDLSTAPAQPPPAAPRPRSVSLPVSGVGSFYTREQLTAIYGCSHADLGRLLRDRLAPMPIRIEGAIYWFEDEVAESRPGVTRVLERRRR